jgi:death-on-curing protein
MHYLTREEIIRLNKRTLDRHGGHYLPPQNLLHESALDYLVETVEAEMFGEPLYPQIWDKAGLYFFNIISNHVFQDGNKRTGLAAALTFLLRNGYVLREQLQPVSINDEPVPSDRIDHDDHLYDFTLATAAGQVPLKACQQWFAANAVRRRLV